MIRFLDRVGLSLVAPRRAFELAHRGQGGLPDAAWLLVLKFLCTETIALLAAGWVGFAVGPLPGLSAALGRLQAAVGMDILVIVAAGGIITLFAGKRRRAGRDFDLAGVAWVPFLVVGLLASLVATVTRWDVPSEIVWGLGVAVVSVRVFQAVRFARDGKPVGEEEEAHDP